jgi:hypothetical protein
MENYKILVSAAHEKKNGTAEHAETAEQIEWNTGMMEQWV